MKVIRNIAAILLTALTFVSCKQLDDERIPYAPVYIEMNAAQWDLYGVSGAGMSRRFIKSKLVPKGYPYNIAEETGFGGVLLVMNYYGDLQAFDLACPVERRADIRVTINDENNAECEVCGSTYSVFENNGVPLSGPASKEGYGLQRFFVARNIDTGTTRISR